MDDQLNQNTFFGPGSPYFSHPLLTTQRTGEEVDVIADRLAEHAGTLVRVLDVGCGFGRHAIEFARRGAEVTAIDPSAAMIETAMTLAADAGLHGSIDFRVTTAGDFAARGLADAEPYDLTIALFTTLGQLAAITEDDQIHQDLLVTMFDSLRPGGHAVIEVPDRQRAVDALVTDEVLGTTHVERSFDPDTAVVVERFTLDSGSRFDLMYRVFSPDELRAMLQRAGFAVGHIEPTGLASPPPTLMTIFARRPL